METSNAALKAMHHRRKMLTLSAALTVIVAGTFGIYGHLDAARRATRQTLCVHNLKFIAVALKSYADKHDGHFPAKLSELWPEYLSIPEAFICPEALSANPQSFPSNPSIDDIEKLCSYACEPGHTVKDPADTVLVYEKRDNHFGKGRSLLYLDGHGAWEPPHNWRYGGPPNVNLPPGFAS